MAANPNIFEPITIDDGFKSVDANFVNHMAMSDRLEFDGFNAVANYSQFVVGSDTLHAYYTNLRNMYNQWGEDAKTRRIAQPVAAVFHGTDALFTRIGLITKSFELGGGSLPKEIWLNTTPHDIPNSDHKFLLALNMGYRVVDLTYDGSAKLAEYDDSEKWLSHAAQLEVGAWKYNAETDAYDVSRQAVTTVAFGREAIVSLPEFPIISEAYERIIEARANAFA